jgi:predicted transcriptional regulator YdeE
MVLMTKTQRLIELMMKVYEKPHFTVDEMAKEFDVSYRTMLRYLQELSGLGVPLYSETGKHGGYTMLQTRSRPALERSQSNDIKPMRRVIKPAFHLLGVELKAPFTAIHMSNVIIPRLWEQLRELLERHDLASDTATRIAAVQSRQYVYHYIAGVETRKNTPVPDGMIMIEIPLREYFVYTHQGAQGRDQMDETYLYALQLMRSKGLEPELQDYSLQIYKTQTPARARESEICIPIRPL